MIPKLHSVRFKSGGSLRVLPSAREDMHRLLQDTIKSDVATAWKANDGMIVGYAMIIWTAHGDAAGTVYNTRFSPVPTAGIVGVVSEQVRKLLTKIQVNRMFGRDDSQDAS